MPIDPFAPVPLTPEGRVADKLRELERRIAWMERGNPLVTSGAGAPGANVTAPFYVDTAAPRLYVRSGSGYLSVALT